MSKGNTEILKSSGTEIFTPSQSDRRANSHRKLTQTKFADYFPKIETSKVRQPNGREIEVAHEKFVRGIRWDDLIAVRGINLLDHLQICSIVLSQVIDVLITYGILLADRDMTNVFVVPHEEKNQEKLVFKTDRKPWKIKQIDFGHIFDVTVKTEDRGLVGLQLGIDPEADLTKRVGKKIFLPAPFELIEQMDMFWDTLISTLEKRMEKATSAEIISAQKIISLLKEAQNVKNSNDEYQRGKPGYITYDKLRAFLIGNAKHFLDSKFLREVAKSISDLVLGQSSGTHLELTDAQLQNIEKFRVEADQLYG